MRIQQVRIEGFRSLHDVQLRLGNVTTLIGQNGTGKSSVLRALDWFFNGPKNSLTDSDLAAGSAHRVRVEVEFGDLTAQDRAELGKYAADASPTVTLWKTWEDGEEIFSGNARIFEPFSEIRKATSAADKKAKYKELLENRPDLELPSASTGTAVEQAMTSWEASHPETLTDAPEEMESNFFGFLGGAKLSGLFDYVFVSADLRATEESIDVRNAILGKLIGRAIDKTEALKALGELYGDLSEKHTDIVQNTLANDLNAIGIELTNTVGQFTNERQVVLGSDTPKIRLPELQIKTTILDGDLSTDVGAQGHGFQRALLLAALQVLASKGSSGGDPGTIVLAIEEPELYQHPAQARSLAATLRSLAEDKDQRIQVAYATHSPLFIEPGNFNQLIRFKTLSSNDDASRFTKLIAAQSEDVVQRLEKVMSREKVLKQIEKVCPLQLAEAVFADAVILVEGETDRAVLEGVISSRRSLRGCNIAVVECGGKGSIPLARAILESLSIRTISMADTDSNKRCDDDAGATPKQREAEEFAITQNRALLEAVGVAPVDWPSQGLQDGADLVFLDPNLEAYLRSDWEEWEDCRTNLIKDGMGFDGKHFLTYREAARGAALKEVPSLLLNVIQRLEELVGHQ